MELVLYPTIVRLLVPLLIFRWPLAGTLLSAFIDLYDWKLINFKTQADYDYYRAWDKVMDVYYLSFAFYTSFFWKDTIAKKLSIALFSYRIIGVVLYFLFENLAFIFFFPNVFENFFYFYMFYKKLAKKDMLFTSFAIVFVVLLSLTIPKMIHEYFMNILVLQPWQIVDVGSALGASGTLSEYINYLIFGFLFHILPIAVLLILIKRNR